MSDAVVYLACAEACQIEVRRLDPNGRLALQSVARVTDDDGPSPISMPLALSADGRFVYAVRRDPPYRMVSFAVGAGGDLTLLETLVLPASVAYVAAHDSGRHLVCGSGPGGVVFTVAVERDGTARHVRDPVAVTGRGHCAVFSPTGPFVYASSIGDDRVVRFRFDPDTGALDDPHSVDLPPGCHPRHLLFRPGGSILYALTEAHATVVVLSVDQATGELAVMDVVPTRPAGFDALAADLHLTRHGRFLYVSERNADLLTQLSVADEGRLRVVAEVPTEEWTRSFAIDPDSRFLLAPGQHTDHVTVYAIDADTGALRPVHRCPTGGNPSWVEVRRAPN